MGIGRTSFLTIASLFVASEATLRAAPPKRSPSPALFARCEAEAAKRFGKVAISDIAPKSGLKKLRGSEPAVPELPHGTRSSGLAIHELLIGPDGKVQAVWPVREPRFEPPFPAFSEAVVAALQTWEYEPHRAAGKGVPACILVRTDIHWR
jgi:hypothetical protein